MRRAVSLLGAFLLSASPVAAQQIAVRSGEHEGFSRLVFMVPPGTEWKTERIEGGYRLSLPGRQSRFDLGRVFSLIPKTRVQGISADPDARSVRIDTAETVHLEAFQLPIGAIVLDIVDGAPEPEPAADPNRLGAIPAPLSHIPPPDRGYLGLYWAGSKPAATPPGTAAAPEAPPTALNKPKVVAPDPRVAGAELALIEQMSRAASQGLIRMELPKNAGHAGAAQEHMAEEPAAGHGEDAKEPLALQSETVIDRDTASLFAGRRLAVDGHSCPPDRNFDIQAWLGEKSPAELIADARRDLVGEFDKPRPEAIEHLAEIYVGLGFGIESKALLSSFGADPKDFADLLSMAAIVEGLPAPADSPLPALTGCNGKVALWGLLAYEKTPPKAAVNFGAVVRAYAALPPQMREIIGPPLSARLVEMGAGDVASTVRSMLKRAPIDTTRALDQMDAHRDLHEGRASEAAALLDEIAQSALPSGAESLALSIETKLSLGEAIPQQAIENASALGLQMKGTELGARLEKGAILGLASTGQFEAAFDLLDRWHGPQFDQLKRQGINALFAMLARVPDQRLFVETFFRHRDRAVPADLVSEVQVALANRLSEAGFWRSAREMIIAPTRNSDSGRLALARAALAGHDGSAAYSHLIGLEGDEAAVLRGEALSLLGRHNSAQNEFAQADLPQAQLAEAWRAGDLQKIARDGTEAQKRFVELFDPAAQAAAAEPAASAPTGAPLGPLAEAQRLISLSQSEREAFAKIMAGLDKPEPTQP